MCHELYHSTQFSFFFFNYVLTLLRTLAWRIWNQSVMTSLILDLKTFRFSLQKQVIVAFPTLQKYTCVLIVLNYVDLLKCLHLVSQILQQDTHLLMVEQNLMQKLFKLSPNSSVITWLFSSKNVFFWVSYMEDFFRRRLADCEEGCKIQDAYSGSHGNWYEASEGIKSWWYKACTVRLSCCCCGVL